MPANTYRDRLDASPEAVWAVLAEDFCRLDTWFRGPTSCRAEAPGPVGVGTARLVGAGGVATLREEVVVYEPHRWLAYTITGLPLLKNMRSDWYLLPDGDGTEVRLCSTFDGAWGPAGALVARAFDTTHRRTVRSLVRALKRHVDKA